MLLKFIITILTVAASATAKSCAGVKVTGGVSNNGVMRLEGNYVESATCNERTSYKRADDMLLYFFTSTEGDMWAFTTSLCATTTKSVSGRILDNSIYPYDAPKGEWQEYVFSTFATIGNLNVECTNDTSVLTTTTAATPTTAPAPAKLGASSIGFNISLLMASVIILGLLKM